MYRSTGPQLKPPSAGTLVLCALAIASVTAQPGCSRVRESSPSPCTPYAVAHDRIRNPFPGDAIDAAGARFLARRAAIPPRSRGGARPRAFIYSLTPQEVSLYYQGLDQDTTRAAFAAHVRRNFRNSEEERLIRIAEESYPPREAVLSVAQSSGKPIRVDEKYLWSYGEFDGVRLPYAVTMDAVRYYLRLTQSLGRGDSAQTHGIRMRRSDFYYHADITPRPATFSRDGRIFKDVYVVELGLRWSNYCGSLCACSFRLDRIVVLRRDGAVLCVFGDRQPMVLVS